MDYNKSIHRLGRISTSVAILLILTIPIVITSLNQEYFNLRQTVLAVLQVWMVYIPVSITEVLSFTPALGQGGTYLAFLSGNISNMKLPASVSGQNLIGAEPGSDEAEVASVLSIGISTIVTMLVLVIGLFALSPLVTVLENPVLKPGFDNIMPALIGAMLIPYIQKSPKLMIAPLIIAIILGFAIPADMWSAYQGFVLLGTIIISCVVGFQMLKKGLLEPKPSQLSSDK